MIKHEKKAISLIILVITIIVIVILAGAVILSLTNNNPITQASKAAFLSDTKTFEDELNIYHTTEYANNAGAYNPTSLQADKHSVTYNGTIDTTKNISDIITALNQNKQYEDTFQIINGNLVFSGYDLNEQSWVKELGVKTVVSNNPELTLFPKSETIIKSGTDMIYTLEITSGTKITNIDLSSKLQLIDSSGNAVATQPTFDIGTLNGVDTDLTRQLDITIKTSSLAEGDYSLKVLQGAITNSNDLSNDKDVTALNGFTVDNTLPQNPEMSADITSWTNSNVTVTIAYSNDSVIKQYSFDTVTWNNYTSPVVVAGNNTTVYARGYDIAGNESGVATFTVANIDKEAPVITVASGIATTSSVTITATATDTGGSLLNDSSYEYSDDNGATWTAATSDTSYTFTALTSGNYECLSKVTDNAGNVGISNTVTVTTQNLGLIELTATPTSWTNGNVNVTITYPPEVVTKQYSLDAVTWNNYTNAIVVTDNNTTIYAKGLDAGGNQTSQATLTVTNIDKTNPVVVAGNGGVTTSSVKITASATDAGGSSLNTSSYAYSDDNGVTWTAATSNTSYTFTALASGTYQCKVKVLDNAGNVGISDALALTTTGLGTIAMSATPTSWTNGNVTVTITYPSEVITKQYSLDGTTWNTYSSPLTITSNGTIYAKGLDAGGNQTSQATLSVTNIDKTTPSTPVINLNGYTSGVWTSGNITITFSSTDSQSGINKYQISGDGGATWYDTATPWVISNDWQCTVIVRAIDNAGNISGNSQSFVIRRDSTPPSIAVSTTAQTADPVTVTITYPVTAVTKKYKLNSGSWTDYTGPFQITSDSTIYAVSYDAYNNATNTVSYTTSNIYRVLSSQLIFDETDPGLNLWSSLGSATYQLASDQKYTGSYSLKVNSTYSGPQDVVIGTYNSPISVTPGDTYWVSSYGRNSGTTNIGYNIWGYDSTGNRSIIAGTQNSYTPNTWNYITCLFTVPSGITSIYCDWVAWGMQPNTPVWWDYGFIKKVSK